MVCSVKVALAPAGIDIAANMVVKRQGTPEDAGAFLSEVFQQTDSHLNTFQSLQTLAAGIANQEGDTHLNVTGPHSIFLRTQTTAFTCELQQAELGDALLPIDHLQSALNDSLY